MKKVSAFSVFKGKKDKGDTPTIERNSSKRGSIKKASSEPVINGEDDSKSKKLLRAIKGGSFRNTVRGNKHRPTVLADGSGNSPFVAGDSSEVKLTAVKGKNKKEESVNTSINGTPALPKKTKKSKANVSTESLNGETLSSTEQNISLTKKQSKKQVTPKQADTSKSNKQKKTLPPLPIADFTSTPSTSTQLANEETASASKRKGKRELDDSSPNTSVSKKKRVESPKQTPVQPVNPQRKDKINKRKLMPNAVLETVYDSTEEARKLFECMIHPVQTDKFFKELWQKKPLLVRRHISNYNDGWFSTEEFDKILETEHIEFGVNLDVTSYTDGKRETHNPPGRAYRSVIWDYYQNGCSVRMLNPQTYSKNVWKMLSTLQEYFGCCVGANVYLTPPGTQGFAPHYDDIEAFILQLEGKKHWRLYNPLSEAETLPRESSGNFEESEIGSPILNVTLQAGDLLYFPRGTIHQGYALEDAHSLHITFSCYQKNTWGDLFQKLVPRALEIAIEEDVEFREGLPIDYLQYTGVVNSDQENTKRDAFTQKISSLLTKMIQNYCPIDSACDQLGKQYIRDSLPPVFSEMEKSCSVHGHGEKWDPASCTVKGNTEVEPDTMIKLIRKGCLRLITEDDSVRVYHNIENARVYHGRELQFIDITADLAPAVEFLIHSYPEYTTVDSLPAASVEDRVEVASLLYDKGLLITGKKEPDLKDANNNEKVVSNVDNHTKDDAGNEDTLNQKNTGKSGNGQKENSTGKSGNGQKEDSTGKSGNGQKENSTGKSGNGQKDNSTGKSGNGLQLNENCTCKSGNEQKENITGKSGNGLQLNVNSTGKSGNEQKENSTGTSGNGLQLNVNSTGKSGNGQKENSTGKSGNGQKENSTGKSGNGQKENSIGKSGNGLQLNVNSTGKSGNGQKENSTGKSGNGQKENSTGKSGNGQKEDSTGKSGNGQKENSTGKSGNGQKDNSTGKSGNGLQLNENCTCKSGNEQKENITGKSGNGLQLNVNSTGKSGNEQKENSTGTSGNGLQLNVNSTGKSGNGQKENSTGKSGNGQKENSIGKSGNGLQLNVNSTGKSGNGQKENSTGKSGNGQKENSTGKSGNGQKENSIGKSGNGLQLNENCTGKSGNGLQQNMNSTGKSGNGLQQNMNSTGKSGNELQQNDMGMLTFVNDLQQSETIKIYVTNRSPVKNSCINLQENSLHNQQNSMYSFGTVQTRNTELSKLTSTDGNIGLMHGMPKRIMLPDDQNEDMYQAGHQFSMVPGKQNTGMVPMKQIEHWIPDGQGLLMARAEQTNRRLPAEQNENMFQAGHQFSMVPGKQNTGMVPLKQIEHWIPEGQRFMMAMAEQETNRRVPVEQEVNREQTEKSQGREPVEEDGRMLLGRGIENMVPSLLDIEPVKQKCVRAVAKEDGENVEKSEINFRMQADTLMRPDELKEENKSDLKEISVKKEEDFVMFQEDNWTKCNFCPFKSKYKNNVIRHCSVKHNQHAPSYPCCYCDFTSTIMSSVKRHIYLKHKDKENIFQTRTFKCNLCNAIVSTKNDLDEHRKQIHKFMPIKYMCSDCPFETERCDSLVMHQRVIHKKTHFYCCSKCSECFSGAIDYENHVCKARPSRIKCHLCEKTFSSAKCVQAHMKTHSGQGLYFCDKCDKKFSKLYQLQRHHNISHEKKVFYFKCEDCSSSFLYKSSLKRHMKIAHLAHVNADRKRFLRRRRNCGEIRHVDRKVKKYKCPKCLCAFHVEGTLERHMILRHSDALAAEHPVPVMDMQSLTNNDQSSSRLCAPGPYFIDSDTDFLAEESLLQQRNTEDSSQQDRSVYCWKTEYLL